MLALLTERTRARGLQARCIKGSWPAVASQVPPADVLTCHHVLFNVPDLAPFLTALTDHATRLVVVETATLHPLTSLNDMWLRFHDLRRPDRPTADDVLAILDAMGCKPCHERWRRPAAADYGSMAELIVVTRRRLRLPPDRAAEVAEALVEPGSIPGTR